MSDLATIQLPATIKPDEMARLKKRLDDIAFEIGRSAVDHLKVQYPDALDAVTKNAQISLRNHVRNQINWKMRPLIEQLAALAKEPSDAQ